MTAVALTLGSELPWLLQAFIAAFVVVTGGWTLRRYVFMRGRRAMRALEWTEDEEDTFYICLGPAGRRLPAAPDGCRRYGTGLWLLRFRTGEGIEQVFLDARCQEQQALRRLARRLFRKSDDSAAAVAAVGPQLTDTIQRKV